jgi:hypothetical protein
LQIKVGVGEAAGTPVLPGNNFTTARIHRGTRHQCAEFEGPVSACRFLNGRNVFPRLIVAGAVAMIN